MVFCCSVGEKTANPLHVGVVAARAAAGALMNAVAHARGMGGIPASRDLVGTVPTAG